MFVGSGMAAYLISHSRSAREESAEKPRSAGSFAVWADSSRPATHSATRALEYFMGIDPNLSTTDRPRRGATRAHIAPSVSAGTVFSGKCVPALTLGAMRLGQPCSILQQVR